MGTQPLISICIPCYNGERFIARTLESVLNQTFGNFQLLISDNKSTDGTLSVIRTYRDPRIKVVQNESNLGLERNWNKVLSMASGRYVKLLCADDLLYPECLSRQAEILENAGHGRAVLAICNRNIIDARDSVVLRRKLPFRRGLVSGKKLIRTCVRLGTNLIGEPAVGLFRREVLGRIGAWVPANPFVIDLAFWAEILKHGDAFIDPDCHAAFRIFGETASATIGLRQAAHFGQFIHSLRQDPFYRVSRLDAISGRLLSMQWCLLRNIFTRSHTNRPGREECPAASKAVPGLEASCLSDGTVHPAQHVPKYQCRV